MQVEEKLNQVRNLAKNLRKLQKRRAELLSKGSSVEAVDAEIKRNYDEHVDICCLFEPVLALLCWDYAQMLSMFYLNAMPLSEVVSSALELPVNSRTLSLAHRRKSMALRELQEAVDRPESEKESCREEIARAYWIKICEKNSTQ